MDNKSAIAIDYFRRYAIGDISLQMQPGVVDSAAPVCNITLTFTRGYQVQFKMPGGQALLGERVTSLSPDGVVATVSGSYSADLEDELVAFFQNIESRLDRIEHEERVQSITFLGNTFVLDNKTVFDVIGDEGGRLTIAMHKGDGRKPAMLLASSLLDGLYDGTIALKS